MKKAGSSGSRASRARRPRSAERVLASASEQTATSDRILIAAANLFATQGFANTSMPAIAKASGITPGAIYRHFASKAQLLVEVVRYALERLPTSVRVLEPAELNAAELPEFAASYATPEYKLIRQLSLEVHAAGNRARDAMDLLSKVNEESARVISRSISAAQAGGTFDRDLDADFAALFFQVTIMGLAHLDTLRPELIGSRAWHDFILDRVSAVLGIRRTADAGAPGEDDPCPPDCVELEPD